jgi:hypothetical protein
MTGQGMVNLLTLNLTQDKATLKSNLSGARYLHADGGLPQAAFFIIISLET